MEEDVHILVVAADVAVASGDGAHARESQAFVEVDGTQVAGDHGVELQTAKAAGLQLCERVAHQRAPDASAAHVRAHGIAGVGDVRLAADVVGVEDVEPRHAAVELGYAGEALAAEEGGGLLGV